MDSQAEHLGPLHPVLHGPLVLLLPVQVARQVGVGVYVVVHVALLPRPDGLLKQVKGRGSLWGGVNTLKVSQVAQG